MSALPTLPEEQTGPSMRRPVHSFARANELGRALDGWGRFAGTDDLTRAPGQWIRADGDLVRGELDRTQLDLLTVDTPRLVVTRTAADVARTSSTRHIVVVQLAGSSVLAPADGRPSVRLEPGDVSYGDPTVAYRWELSGPLTLMMLRAPLGALPLAPAALHPIVGRPFSSSEGFARLAVRFAEDVLRDSRMLRGPTGGRIVHDVARLFSTMLTERLAQADPVDATQPAFHRAIAYIADHLTEPLAVPAIATAVDMSPRYLQSLFQRRGMSVSGWIRQRRLEVARQALTDPAWAQADITGLAVAHGFADHSHFTRTFRAAYGETPSRWRQRAG